MIILFSWFRNNKLCNRLKVLNTRNMRLLIIVWQHPYVHFHFYFLYLWFRRTRHVRENEPRLLYLNIKSGSYATEEIMDEIYSHRVKTNQEFLKFSVFLEKEFLWILSSVNTLAAEAPSKSFVCYYFPIYPVFTWNGRNISPFHVFICTYVRVYVCSYLLANVWYN